MVGFYRRHVHYFCQYTIHLTNLLKKNAPFIWTSDHQREFDALKEAISNATLLNYPIVGRPYQVYCDACDTGIGVLLCQFKEEGNRDTPVCFLSRKLSSAELNYPTVEKELLAVVYALFKLRRYLLDQQFVVFTDNMAVRYIFSKKEPNTRLQRWCLALQEFNFKIKHIDGKKNPADFLSRYPVSEEENSDEGEYMLEELYSSLMAIPEEEIDYEDELKVIYTYLNCILQEISKKLSAKSKHYYIDNGYLYRKVGGIDLRMVKIPYRQERASVLQEVHDGHGHFGIHSTWSILYRNYWWPGAYQDMKSFIQGCHVCQIYAVAPLNPSPYQGKSVNVLDIFQQFSIDYVGPLPVTKSGSKYILVCVEMFTRWPMAVPTKKADAITAATFLYQQVFCTFGPLTTILSDNGAHFANQVLREYIKIVNARRKFTTPYYPQCNGMVEKFNSTLLSSLRKLSHLKAKTWDEHLPTILYSYRVGSHEALSISPYELMFGISPLPHNMDPLLALGRSLGFERLMALPHLRQEAIRKEKLKISNLQDCIIFKPGTYVLKRNPLVGNGKMESRWIDRVYVITAAFKNNTYWLADAKTGLPLLRKINGIHLKRYFYHPSVEKGISAGGCSVSQNPTTNKQ
jgi:transposase InsO family protein